MKLARWALALAVALGCAPAYGQTGQGASPLSVPKGGSGRVSLDAHKLVFGAGAAPVTLYGCSGFLVGTGTTVDPTCRLIVGSDLPLPASASLGGVKSFAPVTSQWLRSLGTDGAFLASQPNFTDLAGNATAAQGGTGQTSYSIGDLLVASGTTVLAKLADVATGNVLLSGGVGALPGYGKVTPSHVSGVWPVANGGTNCSAASGACLDNIAGFSSTGLMARIGAGSYAFRQIGVPAAGLSISNADGVGGSPTLGLTNDLAAIEALSGTGLSRRTGPDAWSVGTAVANAELANMASGQFKARQSAGSGAPEDLTGAQATALLSNCIGDAGTGGTKGLVPAAGAGDASAGKFLAADCTFKIPAGGGGGGLSDTDRQNILLDRIYQSKLFGGYRRFINAFADGYKATDGVDAVNSSGYSVNTAAGYVSPTAVTMLLHMDGTNGSTTFTDSGPNAHAITAGGATIATGSSKFGGASGAFGTVAGLSFTDNLADVTFAGDFTVSFQMNTTTLSLDTSFRRMFSFNTDSATTLQSYADSNGFVVVRSNASLLTGNTSVADGSWHHVEISRASGTLRLFVDGNLQASAANTTTFTPGATARIGSYNGTQGRFQGFLDEFVVYNGRALHTAAFTPPTAAYNAFDPMTLVSTAQTSDATVSSGRVLLEYDPLVSVTLNTDLVAKVSCNGGVNWATATLSAVTGFSGGAAQRKVAETASTACAASGTSFSSRIEVNKNANIYGASLTVNWLLRRDLEPASNDNSPMWLNAAA